MNRDVENHGAEAKRRINRDVEKSRTMARSWREKKSDDGTIVT